MASWASAACHARPSRRPLLVHEPRPRLARSRLGASKPTWRHANAPKISIGVGLEVGLGRGPSPTLVDLIMCGLIVVVGVKRSVYRVVTRAPSRAALAVRKTLAVRRWRRPGVRESIARGADGATVESSDDSRKGACLDPRRVDRLGRAARGPAQGPVEELQAWSVGSTRSCSVACDQAATEPDRHQGTGARRAEALRLGLYRRQSTRASALSFSVLAGCTRMLRELDPG